MVSKTQLLAFASALSLVAVYSSIFPWINNHTPKNYRGLYNSLLQGYDVSFSGNLNKCFHPLSLNAAGAVITNFRYLNDSKIYGAERIESNYAALIKNSTGSNSTAFQYNYWRQYIYPNQSVNLYTSDISYSMSYETNAKLSECSFDQFSFQVIEYVKPTHLQNFEAIKTALVDGKIVRFRAFTKQCLYTNSLGSNSTDTVVGAILQSYKLFGETSGIQEYISFSDSHLFKNIDAPIPTFINELTQYRLWKNGTTTINTYYFGADNKATVLTSWASCNINNGKQPAGINFYTSDHSIL